MITLPSLSRQPPIRFLGYVAISPEEARELLLMLPEDLGLAVELRNTLSWSVAAAEKLNRVDRGEAS